MPHCKTAVELAGTKLPRFFSFDYYGMMNVIEKEQWNKIVEKSKENEQWKLVIEELRPWAEECFAQHECFTVCGI